MNTKFKTVDEYIAAFPEHTRVLLEQLRTTARKAAPKAEELISYNMPALKQDGVLVYYAGYAGHIGFYPTGSGIAAFQKEISAYKSSKGAVQFPLDKPMPLKLITAMVTFRLKENAERARQKAAKKTKQA